MLVWYMLPEQMNDIELVKNIILRLFVFVMVKLYYNLNYIPMHSLHNYVVLLLYNNAFCPLLCHYCVTMDILNFEQYVGFQ